MGLPDTAGEFRSSRQPREPRYPCRRARHTARERGVSTTLILLANSRRRPMSRSLGELGALDGRNPAPRTAQTNSPAVLTLLDEPPSSGARKIRKIWRDRLAGDNSLHLPRPRNGRILLANSRRRSMGRSLGEMESLRNGFPRFPDGRAEFANSIRPNTGRAGGTLQNRSVRGQESVPLLIPKSKSRSLTRGAGFGTMGDRRVPCSSATPASPPPTRSSTSRTTP